MRTFFLFVLRFKVVATMNDASLYPNHSLPNPLSSPTSFGYSAPGDYDGNGFGRKLDISDILQQLINTSDQTLDEAQSRFVITSFFFFFQVT
jgi:hypothetical protein